MRKAELNVMRIYMHNRTVELAQMLGAPRETIALSLPFSVQLISCRVGSENDDCMLSAACCEINVLTLM